MTFAIELTDEQVRLLSELATELGITAERLAAAAVVDLISKPSLDYVEAADYVLRKNAELYRRLS
jgi:predicted transcriptional regulator